MKPVLVIGLGNPLMGDDGVGPRAATLLATDPRLPDTVDVIAGGSDLLRFASDVPGRERVVVIDAADDGNPPGTIRVRQPTSPPSTSGQHAHHLSAIEAIALLRLIADAPVFLLTVSVETASPGWALSPAVESRLADIVSRALAVASDTQSASISDTPVL